MARQNYYYYYYYYYFIYFIFFLPAPRKVCPSLSYTMGTGSFLEVKRPGCGLDHPPHLAPRLKKE